MVILSWFGFWVSLPETSRPPGGHLSGIARHTSSKRLKTGNESQIIKDQDVFSEYEGKIT